MKRSAYFALILFLQAGFLQIGCGYSLQSSKDSPLRDEYGIRRVYVKPLVNNTYKPGVENLVYNELVRTLGAGGRVKVVHNLEEADAVLSGSVTLAGYSPAAQTSANQLKPIGEGSPNLLVATEYSASLGCGFTLERRVNNAEREEIKKLSERKLTEAEKVHYKQKKTLLWSGAFSRSKSFPANNQIGVVGTTSALINESEFDRALQDLAVSVMDELHESMTAMF